MVTFPNAKINLGLNVVERRSDGYHNLETVFYPIALSDILEVIPASAFSFSTSGTPVEGDQDNNLVIKAYRLLKEKFDLPPINVHLHKVIPTGAGLGGGSSDAAFMLKMLNRLFGLQLTFEQLNVFARQLGADCPFFISNRPAFATGIGDELQPADIDLSSYKLVLVKPPVAVNTSLAYKDIVPKQPLSPIKGIIRQPVATWKNQLINDFEQPVIRRFPEIGFVKMKLIELGAVYAAMSGSGSAVFALFEKFPEGIENEFPDGFAVYR